MNLSQLRSRCKPHLWFQLYWVVYLVWFFWLDLTIKDPKYIIHSPLDDSIPFNEWFVFPYCSWFLLLAGVTAALWSADASVNVCPSIHCQSSACMALAFSSSTLTEKRPGLKVLAWVWAALICASTVFTKQHSIVDVVCGLAVAFVWVPVLYRPHGKNS